MVTFGSGFGEVFFGSRRDMDRRKFESVTGEGDCFGLVNCVGVVALATGFFVPGNFGSGSVGANSSSSCRLADMKGSYLSEKPLKGGISYENEKSIKKYLLTLR